MEVSFINIYQFDDIQNGLSEFYLLLNTYKDCLKLEKSKNSISNNMGLESDLMQLQFNQDKFDKSINTEVFSFIFKKLFNYMDLEVKIIKIYFEIKNGFIKLGLNHEAYKLFKKVYYEYTDNIFVSFEYLKLSIIVRNYY